MKIQVLHASVNPNFYDLKKIGKMSFGEAREFFEDDNVCCCNWGVDELNPDVFNSNLYKPEGNPALAGDTDALFVWVKVVPWK